MSKPEALLTFDLGTTACKAALFRTDGRLLATASAEYPTHHPQPDWAEQDPLDWWGAAVATGREVLAQAEGTSVVGIGLSSQRETVVPVDETGAALHPAILWMDRRSAGQAAALAAHGGEGALHRRTGMRCDATFTATKLRWLSDTQPDLVHRARWFLQPKDYLIMRLTGRPALDPSLASRTLLWQSATSGWATDLVEWCGIQAEQLPPVAQSGSAVGNLTTEAARVLGLPEGIPVATGAGDRACEALGAGIAQGAAMVSIGTAVNVSAAAPAWPADPVTGVLYSVHSVQGQWLAEQGVSTGGTLLRWLRDLVGASDYDALAAEAAASPPGAGGVLLLPFFMGARSTRWNPAARGVLAGLTLGHKRGDLARAVMEGLALEIRACFALADPDRQVREVAILGGGARSPLWCAIIAAATGRPAVTLASGEAASVGAAVLAAQAVGLTSDPAATARHWNPPASQHQPDPQWSAYYEKLFGAYDRLYGQMIPVYQELEELAREGERMR